MTPSPVSLTTDGPVATITLHRPECRNAVDGPTAAALRAAFDQFEADDSLAVAVFTGGGGQFCAGADLKAVADSSRRNQATPDGSGPGPMGPTRQHFSKPVIAAVEGHAVAGGLELALMCDLRVAARGAIFGVYCRRWGVPLIDGGTVRLPRIVGQARALDMILTGRAVGAEGVGHDGTVATELAHLDDHFHVGAETGGLLNAARKFRHFFHPRVLGG
jgi:enoyl-CoA hydratase